MTRLRVACIDYEWTHTPCPLQTAHLRCTFSLFIICFRFTPIISSCHLLILVCDPIYTHTHTHYLGKIHSMSGVVTTRLCICAPSMHVCFVFDWVCGPGSCHCRMRQVQATEVGKQAHTWWVWERFNVTSTPPPPLHGYTHTHSLNPFISSTNRNTVQRDEWCTGNK